jgi:S-adenosylmethionine uptake transporter
MKDSALKILEDTTVVTLREVELETEQDSLSPPLPSTLDRVAQWTAIGWFFRKGFPQGAFWATMIGLVSALNDVLMRFLGENLHFTEIIFFRFLFGTLAVIPLMLSQGVTLFKTSRPLYHILRAVLGVGAFFACCYGVNQMPLNENTIIMSSQPLFFLPLAIPFLGERVDRGRWIATIIGFLGILFIVQPGTDTFKLVALIPIAAAVQFALLDILAKKMVVTENTYNMLFYFALGTTLLSAIPAFYFWQTPTLVDLGLLILLGIGANLIQVCLIRAFSATDASALTPFRYVDFLFALLFGFVLFAELPRIVTLVGACFIVVGTLLISYIELHREKRGKNRPRP